MVFEDPSRSRWRVVRLGLVVLGLFALLLALSIAISLGSAPKLPRIASAQPSWPRSLEPALQRLDTNADGAVVVADHPAAAVHLPSFNKPFLRTAFMVQDDEWSVEALRRNIHRLDVVFPDWYTFTKSDGSIDKHIDITVAGILHGANVLIFPSIANTDSDGNWQTEAFGDLIRDDDAVGEFANNLMENLLAAHAQGVNLDIEGIRPEDTDLYLDWLESVVEACHKHHLLVTVDVPMNDENYDYEQIGRLADGVVLMAYDEHYATGTPGPVASQPWLQDGIEGIVQRIPPEKLIVALGSYGYDWVRGGKDPARDLTFADAIGLADQYGSDIETDVDARNSHFTYKDAKNLTHDVWFLDAVSAWDEYLVARDNKVRGISLWRLGLEEPAVWDFLGSQTPEQFQPSSLCVVPPLPDVNFVGDGEMLQVDALPSQGRRDMTYDGRSIAYASYQKLPEPYLVHKTGKTQAMRIALSFDDGPDPTWTPRILKVLADNNVHATFFLIGQHVQDYPQVVRAEVAAGHVLGNHTFLHPDISKIWDSRLRLELNATQRVIESVTGLRTILFRPPYDIDTTPATAQQLVPLRTVTEMGYIIAGADVDSEDYTKPGTARIVRNVTSALQGTSGSQVILMHDGGGDRHETVEALKVLIPTLRNAGYSFATLDELMGGSRQSAMPSISTAEQALVTGDRVYIASSKWGWKVLLALFAVTTGFSILRILFMGWFVLRRQRRERRRVLGGCIDTPFEPPVLVLVPAYNEEKVIGSTLSALMNSDYPDFRVLVVDDGSTDATSDIVREFALDHPNVEVRTKRNSGKAAALNLGFRLATEPYIVTIDADTMIGPRTIRRLVEPFADPTVDAVCGNVQVGNVRGVLTAFQDVEYVTCQNYDRRAFDSLNCISVVPGATGAWKRETVLSVGGYSRDTLTEDADLTLTVLETGGRIVYAPEARSVTEAPEGPRALYKQRFRWSFGTFQCLWKHAGQFGHGALGCVAMPNMLLFQVIFPLLAPLGDLVMVLSLIHGDFAAVAIGYSMFLAMDLIGSLIAYRLDGRKMGSLVVVFFQRFYYRQFMYIVALRAVMASLRGRRHGWNKLERSAYFLEQRDEYGVPEYPAPELIAQPAGSPVH